MINLIPPKARKKVTREYWTRVASVWLFLIAAAGIVTVVLAVPVYFLVQNINIALSGQFDQVKEQQKKYEEAEMQIKYANALVKRVMMENEDMAFTDLLSALEQVSGVGVELNQIVWSDVGAEGRQLGLTGIAKTRSELSQFVTDLNNHTLFDGADLPISNLAKDRDIRFSMTVKISKETTE